MSKPPVEERNAAYFLERKDLCRGYEACFGTPSGRAVYKDLARYCGVLATNYTGNSAQYFLEGRRDVFLHILDMIRQGKHADDPEPVLEELLED